MSEVAELWYGEQNGPRREVAGVHAVVKLGRVCAVL